MEKGDKVKPFTGANTSLGTLFLRTNTRHEMDEVLSQIDDHISIIMEY